MANHRKYASEEERKAAYREKYRERAKIWQKNSREKKKLQGGRQAVSNPCKHKLINLDCIKIDVGTLNRTYIDTAYIDMLVSVAFTDDEEQLLAFRTNVGKAFREWLLGQDMWDKKNRIIVMDYSMPVHKNYSANTKSFSVQLHVRRDEITDWNTTYESLSGLVDVLVETIKKTCVETGLPLRKWKSKENVELEDPAASVTAEPHAS